MLEQGLEMVFEWIEGDTGKYYDMAIKLALLTLMVGLTSYARARVAVWWGDLTPAVAGQLSPDPRVHFSMINTFLFPAVFLYLFQGVWTLGSGKPIARNPEILGNHGRLLTALAAPVASLLLGLITLGVMIGLVPVMDLGMHDMTYKILQIFCFFCLFHACLQLLPFPPFDGGEILRWLLPGQWLKDKWDVFARWFGLLFMVLIIIGWVYIFTYDGGEPSEVMSTRLPYIQKIGELFVWAITTVDDFIDLTFLDCKARLQ